MTLKKAPAILAAALLAGTTGLAHAQGQSSPRNSPDAAPYPHGSPGTTLGPTGRSGTVGAGSTGAASPDRSGVLGSGGGGGDGGGAGAGGGGGAGGDGGGAGGGAGGGGGGGG